MPSWCNTDRSTQQPSRLASDKKILENRRRSRAESAVSLHGSTLKPSSLASVKVNYWKIAVGHRYTLLPPDLVANRDNTDPPPTPPALTLVCLDHRCISADTSGVLHNCQRHVGRKKNKKQGKGGQGGEKGSVQDNRQRWSHGMARGKTKMGVRTGGHNRTKQHRTGERREKKKNQTNPIQQQTNLTLNQFSVKSAQRQFDPTPEPIHADRCARSPL